MTDEYGSSLLTKWAFAREVADRIIFMADGEVLGRYNRYDDFFDNPSEPRAQQFQQNYQL